MMQIRNDKEFAFGYTAVTESNGRHAETLMDFGILRLREGGAYRFAAGKERALLLLSGTLDISADGVKTRIGRQSIFDQAPWCLHLSSETEATVIVVEGEAEISVHATENPRGSTRLKSAEAKNEARAPCGRLRHESCARSSRIPGPPGQISFWAR